MSKRHKFGIIEVRTNKCDIVTDGDARPGEPLVDVVVDVSSNWNAVVAVASEFVRAGVSIHAFRASEKDVFLDFRCGERVANVCVSPRGARSAFLFEEPKPQDVFILRPRHEPNRTVESFVAFIVRFLRGEIRHEYETEPSPEGSRRGTLSRWVSRVTGEVLWQLIPARIFVTSGG